MLREKNRTATALETERYTFLSYAEAIKYKLKRADRHVCSDEDAGMFSG